MSTIPPPIKRARQNSGTRWEIDRSIAPILREIGALRAEIERLRSKLEEGDRTQMRLALVEDRCTRLEDGQTKSQGELDTLTRQRSWLFGAAFVVGAGASVLFKLLGG